MINNKGQSQFYTLIIDIRFWILLFFALRLYGITDAPLEVGHNWRQSLTNMIARNFYDGNTSFFYPMIDMAGDRTGIIGSEFPLFNYLIYIISEVFGYQHWYGRLINLIVSSIGVLYFYKLIQALFSERTALYSSIILLSSIWFVFSRKSMPDTFSVSLMIIGLYHAYRFIQSSLNKHLVYFFILASLGLLCKIPTLSLFSILAIVPFVKGISIKNKILLMSTGGMSFIISCVWYFVWVPYLVDTFHFQLYFTKGLIEGFIEIIPHLDLFFERFYYSALNSFVALIFVIIGVYYLIRKSSKYVISSILIITSFFLLFVLKTGDVFPKHNYYIIPFAPILALLAGFALKQFNSKWTTVLLVFIVIEGIGNQQHDFKIKDEYRYKLKLEDTLNNTLPTNDKIVINGGLSPQDMYFAHRKGWSIYNEELNTEYLDSIAILGARYLVLDKTTSSNSFENYTLLHQDAYYAVYDLKK